MDMDFNLAHISDLEKSHRLGGIIPSKHCSLVFYPFSSHFVVHCKNQTGSMALDTYIEPRCGGMGCPSLFAFQLGERRVAVEQGAIGTGSCR